MKVIKIILNKIKCMFVYIVSAMLALVAINDTKHKEQENATEQPVPNHEHAHHVFDLDKLYDVTVLSTPNTSIENEHGYSEDKS